MQRTSGVASATASCDSFIQFLLRMNQTNGNMKAEMCLTGHANKCLHDAAVDRFFSDRREMESDRRARSLTRVHLLYFHVAACQGEDRGQRTE